MNIWWNIGVLLGFGFVLSASADLVVRATVSLSQRLALRSFTVSFLFLGLMTSTPEIFVGVQSVWEGIPQLAVGNLLGGSILLLSFVMGVCAVALGRVSLDHELKWVDIVLTCAVIASPVAVLADGKLTMMDGFFLIGIYFLHAFLLNREQHIWGKLEKRAKHMKNISHSLVLLLVGFFGMVVSSRLIVENAKLLISSLDIPALVFGLFVVSLGTNLPELALAWESVREKRREIAFGDFLGSAAANTLILGFVAVASPVTSAFSESLMPALFILGGLSAYFLWSLSSGRTISRKEGLGLLFFYLTFLAYALLG